MDSNPLGVGEGGGGGYPNNFRVGLCKKGFKTLKTLIFKTKNLVC